MSTYYDLDVGRVSWSPVYRVSVTTDPSVRAVSHPVNSAAEAIVQLQEVVAELQARVTKLENLVTEKGPDA